MKKKYTNQATKSHSSLYSESGPKSKAASNFSGRAEDVPSKKLEKTEISNPVRDEMSSREYANSKTSEDESPALSRFKEGVKKDYEIKDTKMKNDLDKATLERKVKNYEDREKKLGGSKAVSKKIKRREFARKAAGPTALAGIAAGVTKMGYDIIQQNKKREAEK
jgi:hypothetical protein